MTEAKNNLADVDFSALVLGFSSAALSYLGFSETGAQVSTSQNLDLAAQNIEILRILAEKTEGNLTDEEKTLLQSVLTDLRLKFVEAKKA